MQAASSPNTPSGSLKREPRKILVLEDDPDLVILLKDLLESENYAVTTVQNGVDGLREVSACDFDVIVCDLMLPSMPGHSFFEEVQNSRPLLAKRFVFLTGHSDSPRITQFIQQAGNPVLYKPVSISELLRTIATVTEKAE